MAQTLEQFTDEMTKQIEEFYILREHESNQNPSAFPKEMENSDAWLEHFLIFIGW
jgi:hypothetical protein